MIGLGRGFVWALATLPLASLGVSAAPAPSSTLRVFAAASLADAFGDLARHFERTEPGVKVVLDFAGSQTLATQIEQGAPADVFASADDRWMSEVEAKGLVAETPARFARNRLALLIPRSNPARLHQIADLARPGIKLVLASASVPAGRYARDVLANLSKHPDYGATFSRRVLANLVSEEDNVRAVVTKVQLGEADAGIAYRSDVSRALTRFLTVIEIPEFADVVASYPIAALKGAQDVGRAHRFVALVRSEQGQRILEAHGLMRPDAPPP